MQQIYQFSISSSTDPQPKLQNAEKEKNEKDDNDKENGQPFW